MPWLAAFSILLPKVAGTNVRSWVLDFESEPERNLSQELIAGINKDTALITHSGMVIRLRLY